ncbi:MAG: hypothetical protein JWP97_4413 [Labilithrix sp.]|nr:hypothetical protein [Labilithrix sp.]
MSTSSEPFTIAYAAHTASCTFLLDEDGICRRIVLVPNGKPRNESRTSAQCVGAQYVASLDATSTGGLVELPREGSAMLFARLDENGRISLVRTGTLLRFESQPVLQDVEIREAERFDPFVDSHSVETSAPHIEELRTPRNVPVAQILESRRPHHEDEDEHLPSLRDPDYQDMSARTQRIPALRPEDFAAVPLGDDDPTHQMGRAELEMATAQWRSIPAPRQTLPSPAPGSAGPSARGVLPRRSTGNALAAVAPQAAPPAHDSDVRMTRRARSSR